MRGENSTDLSVSFHAEVGNAFDNRCAGVIDAIEHRLGRAISTDYTEDFPRLAFNCIILATFGAWDE